MRQQQRSEQQSMLRKKPSTSRHVLPTYPAKVVSEGKRLECDSPATFDKITDTTSRYMGERRAPDVCQNSSADPRQIGTTGKAENFSVRTGRDKSARSVTTSQFFAVWRK